MMRSLLLAGLALGSLACIHAMAADNTSAADVEKLLKRGGNHWSAAAKGFGESEAKQTPGEVLYLWPAEDRVYRAVGQDSSSFVNVKFHWQLRPGAAFPEQASKYFLYQWGKEGGKLYGFQLTRGIDRTARSGTFSVSLSFARANLGGEQEVVFGLFRNAREAKPLGNFVRLKVAFPAK